MKQIVVIPLFACVAVLSALSAGAVSPDDANFRNLHIEGVVKPEDIKKTADFVVETAERANAVFGSYTGKVDKLFAEMTNVSNDVTQAVNAWIGDPNDESKAHLREIITDGALRVKTAADALAAETPKIVEVVQLARTSIKSKVDETTGVATRISTTLTSLSKQRENLLEKLKDTYERLNAAGIAEGETTLTPELQEELAKLKTDWIELNFIADQWSSKAERMRAFADKMSQATSRFDSVERMVRLAGYQANSFSRIASAIGSQGADDIPLEMWEKTFGELTDFEEAIAASSKRFEGMPFDLGQLRDAGKASWAQPNKTASAPTTPGLDSTALLAWLRETVTVQGTAQQPRLP